MNMNGFVAFGEALAATIEAISTAIADTLDNIVDPYREHRTNLALAVIMENGRDAMARIIEAEFDVAALAGAR